MKEAGLLFLESFSLVRSPAHSVGLKSIRLINKQSRVFRSLHVTKSILISRREAVSRRPLEFKVELRSELVNDSVYELLLGLDLPEQGPGIGAGRFCDVPVDDFIVLSPVGHVGLDSSGEGVEVHEAETFLVGVVDYEVDLFRRQEVHAGQSLLQVFIADVAILVRVEVSEVVKELFP